MEEAWPGYFLDFRSNNESWRFSLVSCAGVTYLCTLLYIFEIAYWIDAGYHKADPFLIPTIGGGGEDFIVSKEVV